VLSLIRRARDRMTLPGRRGLLRSSLEYRIGVPEPGWYRELLNSDSEIYGGSNWGTERRASEPEPATASTTRFA